MTKKSMDAVVAHKPFRPVGVRMGDGRRFRLTQLEQFIVGRDDIAVLTKAGTVAHFSIGRISMIRPVAPRRRRA